MRFAISVHKEGCNNKHERGNGRSGTTHDPFALCDLQLRAPHFHHAKSSLRRRGTMDRALHQIHYFKARLTILLPFIPSFCQPAWYVMPVVCFRVTDSEGSCLFFLRGMRKSF